jgi:hypothetical protein
MVAYASGMIEGTSRIPELDLARIRRYRTGRIPARVAHLIRLEIDVKGGSVTILECRPPWSPDMGPEWTRFPIARLCFTVSRGRWTLYWRDRNLAFHRYSRIGPSPNVGVLLAEIEADPAGIFWG